MEKHEYEIGKVYGCRKLLKIEHKAGGSVAYSECIYCGKMHIHKPDSLYNSRYNSCQCRTRTHGDTKSRLYGIWGNMKYRCNRDTAQGYHNYGGKGVRVCDEWNQYEPFKEWSLSHGYQDNLTIDRIDSDGDYCPENCRWITKSENTACANKGKQHRRANKGKYYAISPDGEYREFDNAAEFGREHGLNPARIRKVVNMNKHKHTYDDWIFGFVCDIKKQPEPQSTIESSQQ